MEEDFQFMSREDSNGSLNTPKKKAFPTLFTNGKYKIMASLYNYVHPLPTELPPFSSAPLCLLGKWYRNEPKIIGKNVDPFEMDLRTSQAFRKSSNDSYFPHWKKRPKHIDEFLTHFHSLLWFCYRKDFPPLEPSQLTTDIGWGCMLRTGQMMLAEILVRRTLGRDWRVSEQDQLAPYSLYRQILRYFSDSPSPKSPYSIHNIVTRSKIIDAKLGADINKVGEWFTPTRVSQIMKYLVRKHSPEALTVYVSRGGVIYKRDVENLCTKTELYDEKSPPSSPISESPISKSNQELYWRPVFIVVPVRLGLEKINKVYIQGLKALLQLEQSCGIIGGRPRQSLYFVGFQDDEAFYLDPHTVKPSIRSEQEYAIDSYHCNIPGKIPMEMIDPSLALGFYCESRIDFEKFCASINELGKAPNPIFTIEERREQYEEDETLDDVVVL